MKTILFTTCIMKTKTKIERIRTMSTKEDIKVTDLKNEEIWVCSKEMREIVDSRKKLEKLEIERNKEMSFDEDIFVAGKELLDDMKLFDYVDTLPVLYQMKTYSNNIYNINYFVIQKMIASLMLDKGLINQDDYEVNSFILEYNSDCEGNVLVDVIEHCPCNMQDRELKNSIIVKKNNEFVRTWLVTLYDKVVCLDEWGEWKKSNRIW